jgi:hypothetical protein
VILVAAFLLLVALGLLAGGLAQGSAALQWGSFAASALAALTLAVGAFRGRGSGRPEDGLPAGAAAEPTQAGALAAPAPAPAEPGGPAGTSTPSAAVPAAGPASEPAGEPAEPSAPEADPPAPAHSAGAASAHAAGTAGPATGAHAAAPVLGPDGEPPVEEVEVTDLLLVLDLTDEVLVVDEHPRYHLAGCPHLTDIATIPLPMDEARADGFTPCGTCAPDHNLAQRERARRA